MCLPGWSDLARFFDFRNGTHCCRLGILQGVQFFKISKFGRERKRQNFHLKKRPSKKNWQKENNN